MSNPYEKHHQSAPPGGLPPGQAPPSGGRLTRMGASGTGHVERDIGEEPKEFISTSGADLRAVNYLNDLFANAVAAGYSDIHFEDTPTECLVRARYNGELKIIDRVSLAFSREFDSKIRMKCRLPVVERMRPLDGKLLFERDGRRVDVRISILPLARGQSIVCRLLDQKANLIRLDDIRMPEEVRAAVHKIIAQPQGLFLVTGPTGSGKTTTLYGILQQVNTEKVKILTVEDPVEYHLPGTNQSQVNQHLTFASALKSMLRQDPDIILVGEIRDSETASIAVQASLTGHIVLSTLHANSALLTLNRLLDLGVDPHALSAAMSGFMAQRLIRELCPHCRIPAPIHEYARRQFEHYGLSSDANPEVLHEPNPEGCAHCRQGWVGRRGIFELINSSPQARLAVESRDLRALERAAAEQPQYHSLAYHALCLAQQGRTS